MLTMVGTGSEMNAGAVITNPHTHQKIGQSVGAYTNATHGMTLAAVSLPYYRYILPYGVQKFKRFAVNVWDIDPAGKTDEQTAQEGLDAMEAWMNELGLVMNISDLGATEEMLEGIAGGTIILPGGYKVLEHDEIVEILKESMNEKNISCIFFREDVDPVRYFRRQRYRRGTEEYAGTLSGSGVETGKTGKQRSGCMGEVRHGKVRTLCQKVQKN